MKIAISLFSILTVKQLSLSYPIGIRKFIMLWGI
ncbi:hypothetical protein SAFG77S_07238 [Streptomyces afghaniensis]